MPRERSLPCVSYLHPREDEDSNPMSYFLDSVTELFEYALRDLEDSDMVGITISNEVEVKDRAIGISYRRRDQITGEVIWTVFEKVAQSNARFNAFDKLVVTIHSVKMPIGHGKITSKGRPLETMVHLRRSIVKVKAKSNCLAHALVIAKAIVDGDPNYESYRHGYKLRPLVDRLLETTGMNLSAGGGVPELMRFQEHFNEYRIVVFGGLNCEGIYFDGQVESEKRINLVYDAVTRHYHVTNTLTGAMARQYVCIIKGVDVAKRISAERRVVTASRFLHVRTLKNESHASPAKEILEVDRVSKNIRQTSWKVRPSAKRCEIASCVTCA